MARDLDKPFALCLNVSTAITVREYVDAEFGLPWECLCHGGFPAPSGVPCTVEHAFGVEHIGDGRAAHPYPRADMPPQIEAQCSAHGWIDIEALIAQHGPPDVVPGLDNIEPKPRLF